ncbi:hypothetical protein D3273_27020 [Lichenibacterium minor]|uniref:Uncharacterized protein n=1 Tax=Lichenibacterium minor TaxID=2316528 RepID=A0A4Q2TXM6_9HYPH|nr:hypothetical protein [Lichenibacterium minor]RYC28862.1 hypothetical protein D3273_27020 [Lichenibacterium minor]
MPRSAYPLALDAAPQDGRWLDDPAAVKTVLQFLLSKLPPDQLAEIDEHVTEGTTPQATDHRLPESDLKRDLLKYTPRNRRSMVNSVVGSRSNPLAMDAAERARIHDMLFPNAGRLK